MRNVAPIVLLLLVVVAGCGHGTTAQGTLYNVTLSRSLEAYVPRPLDQVHQGALAAVKEMGYSVQKDALDARSGVIEGKTARDRTVRVETFKHGEAITRLQVYVGGDEPEARDLLEKIEAEATPATK